MTLTEVHRDVDYDVVFDVTAVTMRKMVMMRWRPRGKKKKKKFSLTTHLAKYTRQTESPLNSDNTPV